MCIRDSPRTVLTRWARPGCSSGTHSEGTVIDPGSQIRPRSLRARSTIMTFSARSLALVARDAPAVAGAVPLMGRVSTSPSCHRRKHSGEAVSYTHLRAHETDSYLVCRLL